MRNITRKVIDKNNTKWNNTKLITPKKCQKERNREQMVLGNDMGQIIWLYCVHI